MLGVWGIVHAFALVLAFITKEYNWGLYFGIVSMICFIFKVLEVKKEKEKNE